MKGLKLKGIKKKPLERQIAVSMAGIRAGSVLLSSSASDWWRSKEQRSARRKAVMAREAMRFVDELGKLKGSYVKIGQMLAIFGEHLLPVELTSALHRLECETMPLEWSAIEPTLAEQLTSKLDELEVEKDALAAASLGQVHLATIRKTGERICLKIQYPGINQTIDSDFTHFIRILKLTRWARSTSELDELLEEIRTLLLEEVDYRREARQTRKIARLLADDPRYAVPRVISRYSTDTVLALEYMNGLEVTDSQVQQLSLARRNHLAEAMLDLLLTEIYQWGLLQTDPNFGNYRIQLTSDGDRLVLLDFGAVRSLRKRTLNGLRSLIAAAHQQNPGGVIAALAKLQCIHPDQPANIHALIAGFCMSLLEPLRLSFADAPGYATSRRGAYRWKQSRLIHRAGELAIKSAITPYFRLPPREFALITRKLTGVFSFIATLGAEFNGYANLDRQVSAWEQRSRK